MIEMNFYLSMNNENPQRESAKKISVAEDRNETVIAMGDCSNFLNYQYDQKDGGAGEPTPIPPAKKPAPKKLKDAISKRTATPAMRYISIINK